MNQDPYWSTIEGGAPAVEMYDPALGQSSPVDPFDMEIQKRTQQLQDLLDMRDQAKAEAEKAMAYTGRNPIEQAIVGLAPMALGALLGGKQGLGAGGIGSVAGLKAYDSYADEEAKRQQLIASQFYKDAQANVTASQKAMDALRGAQVTIDAKNQDALEMESLRQGNRLEAIDRKGQYVSGGGLDQPVDEETRLAAEAALGPLPPDITARELGVRTNILSAQGVTEDREYRRQERANDKAAEVEKSHIPGLRWKHLPKDAATFNDTRKKYEAWMKMNDSYRELEAIYARNNGQPIYGDDLDKVGQLTKSLMTDVKDLREFGAAFTTLEAELARYSSGLSGGTPEEIIKSMGQDLLFGTSAGGRARYGRERLQEEVALKMAARNAPIELIDYRQLTPKTKETLTTMGVTWDTKGNLTTKDALAERAAQIRDTSSNRGQMGQQRQSVQQVITEKYPDLAKMNDAQKKEAVKDLLRQNYTRAEIEPFLSGK